MLTWSITPFAPYAGLADGCMRAYGISEPVRNAMGVRRQLSCVARATRWLVTSEVARDAAVTTRFSRRADTTARRSGRNSRPRRIGNSWRDTSVVSATASFVVDTGGRSHGLGRDQKTKNQPAHRDPASDTQRARTRFAYVASSAHLHFTSMSQKTPSSSSQLVPSTTGRRFK
jgi:hypothetical protein